MRKKLKKLFRNSFRKSYGAVDRTLVWLEDQVEGVVDDVGDILISFVEALGDGVKWILSTFFTSLRKVIARVFVQPGPE